MRVGARSRTATTALVARIAGVASFLTVALITGRVLIAVVVLAVGVALAVLSGRRRAAVVDGALYTASADKLVGGVRRRPGQLSITPAALTWIPSRYSAGRGEEEVSIDRRDRPRIELQRGGGLSDLLTVTAADGTAIRLLTRSSRRLHDVLDGAA
jgi:hypothetical protein